LNLRGNSILPKAAGLYHVNLPMDYFEIHDPDSIELIQFYDLLVESFPDPYSREDIDILRYNLTKGSWENGRELCRYHIIGVKINQQIVGGTSFYFFKNGHTALGMGSYLAVKREFWGNGIGSNLIKIRDKVLSENASEFDCDLKALVIQVSDPNLMSKEEIEKDSMNPWEREKLWRKRGYRKIIFRFIQPPIRPGEPPLEYLSLYMFPYCQQWQNISTMPGHDLHEIICCFFKCIGTYEPIDKEPSYIKMKAEIMAYKDFKLMNFLDSH